MATDPGEWTEQKCIELIREFRSKRVLWDQKEPYFFKKTAKPLAWEEIGDALGIPADKCKHKMVVLMSSFRREKAKIMHSIKELKDPSSEVYRSTWFAFKEMAFLLDKENERKRQITGADEEFDAESVQISELTTLKQHIDTPLPLMKGRPRPPKMRREVSQLITQSIREAVVTPPPVQEPTPSSSQTPAERDEEISSFTSFIGNKMKKYSDTTKNAVQQAICDVIFKADQNYYETSLFEKFTIIDEPNNPFNKYVVPPNGTLIKLSDSDAELSD